MTTRGACIAKGLFAAVLAFLRGILRKYFVPAVNRAPIPSDPTVSIEWANAVKVGGTKKVTDVKMVGLSDNRGLVGSVCRAECTIEGGGKKTLFVKVSSASVGGRVSVIASGNWREAMFLNSKYPQMDALCNICPNDSHSSITVFYASGSALLGEYVIVTTDARAERPGSEGANIACGNQIWGTAGKTVPPTWTENDNNKDNNKNKNKNNNNKNDNDDKNTSSEGGKDAVKGIRVVRESYLRAARVHAATWRDPALVRGPDSAWLKGSSWLRGEGRSSWELGIGAARKMWAVGREKLLKSDGVELSDEVVGVVDRSLEAASWEAFQAHVGDSGTPWALCHGDFHASNMVIGPGKDDMLWFDWSETGPWEPMTDLAQLYISDIRQVPGDEARGKDLVRVYHDELVRNGVDASEYTFDRAYDDWCRGGMERWIWVFAVMSSFPLPEKALQYFHDQMKAFMETHKPKDTYVLKPCIVLPM